MAASAWPGSSSFAVGFLQKASCEARRPRWGAATVLWTTMFSTWQVVQEWHHSLRAPYMPPTGKFLDTGLLITMADQTTNAGSPVCVLYK